MSKTIQEAIESDDYAGYAYSYPHKSAYRRLDPVVNVCDAWRDENKNSLFLYLHVPFCEMRCGFCNLFTIARPKEDFVVATVASIQRQSAIVSNSIGAHTVSQLALGGGTPSYLGANQLERVFKFLAADWPIDWGQVQVSFEVSPATVDSNLVALLKSHGIQRISMGIQSLDDQDLGQLGRPQKNSQVDSAIELIRSGEFPVLNLDFIYGVEGQTTASWHKTLKSGLRYRPEEIYLYPLYVREHTGLGRTGKSPSEFRRSLYRQARALLVENGYRQISMRYFRREKTMSLADYCCQEDGMIGLGPGARSYTQSLHYSTEYAVERGGVHQIITHYNQSTDTDFETIDFGVKLNQQEQKVRYLIKSVLRLSGVEKLDYQNKFGCELFQSFPQLKELVDLGYAMEDSSHIRLTETGLEISDVIGPWLYSPEIHAEMSANRQTG